MILKHGLSFQDLMLCGKETELSYEILLIFQKFFDEIAVNYFNIFQKSLQLQLK